VGQAPALTGQGPSYPEPPWHTQGFGLFCPYLVRTSELALPPGFEPMAVLGRSAGVLAYIEYRPPSPLCYSELIWMPALVRFGRAKGHWVARMYVDSEASLAGGREIWKLPKSLARFERRAGRIEVHAEDGTELTLEFSARGPSAPLRSRIKTLQPDGVGAVGFRGEFSARARMAGVEIASFATHDPGWAGFQRARRFGPGAVFDGFESVMRAPIALER
jgi:acetoacetate decarboxylase